MIVQNASEHGVTDISFTVPHADLDVAMEVLDGSGPSWAPPACPPTTTSRGSRSSARG